MEFALGLVERNTGAYVRKNLPHKWSIIRRGEEGGEGRTTVDKGDVAERWLQHGQEGVQEADDATRIAVAAVDNGVAAAAPYVVAS